MEVRQGKSCLFDYFNDVILFIQLAKQVNRVMYNPYAIRKRDVHLPLLLMVHVMYMERCLLLSRAANVCNTNR